jgi:drug/metabolite transporter (DMT)-like permease
MAARIPPSPGTSRLKADLTLLLVSVIWGSAFVAQRVAAEHMGVYLFNGLRFLLGALVLLPLALRRQAQSPPLTWKMLPWILLTGALIFIGASLQQLGMRYTTAGNAGFITGLYVVLIPIILAVGWRQPPRPAIWVAAALATLGLFLLSTGGRFVLALGDALELAGAFMWAFHVILIGWLVLRVGVPQLAVAQYLICALLSLLLSRLTENYSLQSVAGAWWTIVYTGIFSIGIGYTLQAVGQKVAPPADAAILLSLEAVFAALAGWLFLDERLTAIQLVGCGLMLGGMLLAQGGAFMSNRDKPVESA